MKLNVTVFLLKEGRTRDDVLSKDSKPNHIELNINGSPADFYWKSNNSQPRWVKLFEDVEDIDTKKMKGSGVQGLLIVERAKRILCYTFGHARHLINQLSIERYFGLKVALSLSDPDLIKSIDKSKIDKIPLSSRAQSSKYVSISEFEFKFDWEILKSITGVVETDSEDDYELVSGSDSVSLYTEISLNSIGKISDRLLSAYEDDSYKKKYPWVDYIVPVRDKAVIEKLDEAIINCINDKKYDDVWAAPPEIIEYKNFSGFCYKRRGRSGGASQTTSPELDLESCLKAKKIEGKVELSKIKSTKIFLYSAEDQELDSWPLYLCLNGEIEKDGIHYLISEGDWYKIERDFCQQIEKYFDDFPISNLTLPNYKGMHEGPYLEEVSKDKNIYLMDQKLVKPNGASSSIEFCDLLTNKNEIIHVKKYSCSSILSHLFFAGICFS